MDLAKWMKDETKGYTTVVEFGSMFFEQLSYTSCPNKIGIEIHKPYIDRARYHNCKKIEGDFRDFEKMLTPNEMDCAMFIDTLEHLSREDAFDLMEKVKAKFNKIILFIPEGVHDLDFDAYNLGAEEWQTHKSTWYKKDVEELGFDDIVVVSNFHAKSTDPKYKHNDTGAMFCVWRKK
jgi:hypothetical protein